jgi:predicted CoA-binding protein
MTTIKEAAAKFLAHKRVAVTGVSRTPQSHGGNIVYRRLRERGYEVFAVNPNADEVEGDHCYHDLGAIPGGVDAVVIATRPETADATMRECVGLGVTDVWMHRAFGAGSVSPTAAEYGRAHGVTVIDGGCPLMFEPTSDGAHRFLRAVCTMTGKVPRQVQGATTTRKTAG